MIIHFAHANGFPAETYRKFFRFLQPEFEIGYIHLHGHHVDYPVTDNWSQLVDELIHYVEKNYQEPVIGVGHSLGGVLTLLAGIQRPELFRCIVMLDSPILNELRSSLIWLAKRLGFIDRVTSAQRTKHRRVEWPNREAALAYFKDKDLFKNFDPECLQDYVNYGTVKTKEGVRLKFDRQVEYRIFRTIPHHLPRYKKQLKTPAGCIFGSNSKVITAAEKRYMAKHFGVRSVPAKGGHLFPFEYPENAAKVLREMIAHLLTPVAR